MKKVLSILMIGLLATTALQAQNEKKKVFVPVDGSEPEQVAGATRMRELLTEDGRWQVVENESEADVVASYRFFSSGKDHASLRLRDVKTGKTYDSKHVSAHYGGVDESGRSSAEMLHSRCFEGGAYDEEYRGWTTDGFYKLHVRMGASIFGTFATDAAFLWLDGLAEYQLNKNFAFGAGLGFTRSVGGDHAARRSVCPELEAVYYFPNDRWNTQYLHLVMGTNMASSKLKNEGEHLRGSFFNLGYGMQLRNNLAFELFLGRATAWTTMRWTYDPVLGDHPITGKKKSLAMGLKLSYNLPLGMIK